MGRSLRNQNYTTMKKLITAIAIGAFAFVGTTATSEARPYGGRGYSTPASTIYVSGYRYGHPVYTEKYFIGYDCYGRPKFGYRTVSAPRRHYTASCPPPRYVAPCPPPRYSSHWQHGHSGNSVSFTFRR